jgi:flavin reductase (DIM6/NTAB) family NADH-FMN oxidoreductase RutF
MAAITKKTFPLSKIRRFLEPGPTILISSAYKDETDIMANGWHTMMSFTPAIVACYIWDQNHSYSLIRKSKECVINVPTNDLLDKVIGIGNTHGPADKFAQFKLTAKPASKVSAPLIAECFANFECKLVDTRLINRYSLFLFEVVKAHVATRPQYPKTVHYRGDGVFMVSGPSVSRRSKFKRVNL